MAKIISQTLDKQIEPKITVINIVPSIDTKVCEIQSHHLGENLLLRKDIQRLSISRDLPMAQNRFAKDAKLENLIYLSDYKYGTFGKKTGLLMKGNELLTRAVIVLDRQGVIQYLQIVRDITTLPDMKKAYNIANKLK